MKRATLLLDDTIYERAKSLSQKQGTTLKETLNNLLRKALSTMTPKSMPHLTLPLHDQVGPQAGIDISDRDNLYDKMGSAHLRPSKQ